ncbi:hypothetical protein, partial [Mycolicibacterium llatzerense]|uniref:hypothetical protein n=1 Tax=Mycolicibacterium llatzerense TaxID=280871 RepID=UPI0013A6A5AA
MTVPNILVWDQAYNRNRDSKVPRTVVNVIRTYMDNVTMSGFVKRETLAGDTGLSTRQVDRQIAANVDAGWLKIVSRGHSAGKANDYLLTLPEGDTYVAIDRWVETDTSLLDAQGRRICPLDGDAYVLPTSPTTSPDKETTSCSKGDIFVSIGGVDSQADPFGGSADVVVTSSHETTSP